MSEDKPTTPLKSSDILILQAGQADRHYWRDLWKYKELFAILAWRDVAVQYKQTIIGASWAIVRPALTLTIFVVLFQHVAKISSQGDAPYPLLVMAGILPWFLFSTILTNSSNSLVQNSNLISKIYFPRIIVPIASATVGIVDFCVTLILLAGLMTYYAVYPTSRMLAIPLILCLTLICAIGPALLLAALNVRYRDFRFIVPFIVQFGLYVSPVGFPASAIPEAWLPIYSLNPMVGIIEGFRWALIPSIANFPTSALLTTTMVSSIIFLIGMRYFRSVEKSFADVI